MKIADAFKTVVESWKTTLHFGTWLNTLGGLPLVQFRLISVDDIRTNGGYHLSYKFQLMIWDEYPGYCETWEDAKDRAHERSEEYMKILRTIIDIISNPKYNFKYRRPDGFSGRYTYRVIPNETTEHRLVGVVTEGVLEIPAHMACCDNAEYDDSGYIAQLWS